MSNSRNKKTKIYLKFVTKAKKSIVSANQIGYYIRCENVRCFLLDDIYFSKKKSGSKSPTGEIPPLPAEMFDRYKDIYSDSGNPSAKAQRGRHTGQPGRGGSTNQQKSVSQRNAGTNASRAQHHNESRSGASPANTRNSSALNAQRNAVKSKKKRISS